MFYPFNFPLLHVIPRFSNLLFRFPYHFLIYTLTATNPDAHFALQTHLKLRKKDKKKYPLTILHHCVQTVLIPLPLPHTTKFPVHHLFNNVSHGNRQITATVAPKGRNLCFSLRPMCMTPCLLGLPTPTSPPFNPSGRPSWNRNRTLPPPPPSVPPIIEQQVALPSPSSWYVFIPSLSVSICLLFIRPIQIFPLLDLARKTSSLGAGEI